MRGGNCEKKAVIICVAVLLTVTCLAADLYLYQIIREIDRREAEENEEWLIIVTTDHGGSGRDHGKQVYEHRTIWVASNMEIPAEYFGSGYDGFNEN